MSCFYFKLKRNSNPYNLLQDEVLSKEVYNRIVCVANSRANEVSRVPHSPPRIKGIAFAIPFIFLLIRQQGIRTLKKCKIICCILSKLHLTKFFAADFSIIFPIRRDLQVTAENTAYRQNKNERLCMTSAY